MKFPLREVVAIVIAAAVLGSLTRLLLQHDKLPATPATPAACVSLRTEFFSSCLAAEPRYRCEVQWAQLGDRVFDADPSKPWAQRLSCAE